MATPRFAWGVDIGNRALKAIKVAKEGDSLRIDDVEVIEHEQVLSNSGDNRESLIQTALANFAQRHLTKGGVVAVGVSGQASFARFIKLPPVEERKIPEIVKFEAIQQIPFPLDQVEWSYQLFRQTDSPDVEVGIFAMRKELVNQQIKYFTDMDMNVQVVQMSPLAVYNAMYYDNRLADGTTMILDLGAENADLIIADGESVWLRSVPIGGNNFTEALVKSFKLNFAKAEELKRNAQTSKYARQIFQAMRPIFADLVAEIQRSIGFYSSVHRDSRIKRIVALGNTFRLPTLQKYLQQNLQIEVDRLDAFHGGAPDDGRLAAVLNDNIASMAGAYGLALQAMGQGKIGSSLLPLEIKRAKIWKEKTKWFAIAASICVVGAIVAFGMYYIHNDRFEANKDLQRTINDAVSKADKFDMDWQNLENSGGADKTRILNVNSLQRYRDMWADLWLDITKSLPPQNATAPDKLKATPRVERQQVFIESANSQYLPSIGATLKMEDSQFKMLMQPSSGQVAGQGFTAYVDPGSGRGGGGAFNDAGVRIRGGGGGRGFAPTPVPTPDDAAAGDGNLRGYLITLQCTSPSKNALTLVDTTLIKNLLQNVSQAQAFKDHKNYYVARAMIVAARPINADDARKGQLKAAYDQKRQAQEKAQGTTDPLRQQQPFQGRGAPRTVGGRNPDTLVRPVIPGIRPGNDTGEKDAKNETDPYLDPLFPDELVLNDWALTVVIAVVLDPKEPAPAAAANQTAALDPADDRRTALR